jgi:predicted amidohydrolase YtcJ
MEGDLEPVIRLLAEHRWPWRLHATYDQTISRALDVYEKVHRDIPLTGINWFFDHAETISDRNIDRIAALGGGIGAAPHGLSGRIFRRTLWRQGRRAHAAHRQDDRGGHPRGRGHRCHARGQLQPVGVALMAGDGAHDGRPAALPGANRVSRDKALAMWTHENTWFSNEVGKKGQIKAGQLADLAILSDDYFTVPEARSSISARADLLGGKVVHGEGDYAPLARTAARCPTGRRSPLSADTTRRPRPAPNWPRPAPAIPPARSMAMTMPPPLARPSPPVIPRASGARWAAAAGPSDPLLTGEFP